MKERPIIFSGPMVRAILEGRKTQTRRIIESVTGKFPRGKITELQKASSDGYDLMFRDNRMRWHEFRMDDFLKKCPYGEPGDRLWVRENFWCGQELQYGLGVPRLFYMSDQDGGPYIENSHRWWGLQMKWGHHPSIHMPRWASRINLIVKSVRVERLNDISEEDAIAEGTLCDVCNGPVDGSSEADCDCFHSKRTSVRSYSSLWDSINAKRAPWDSNPWVWRIEFEVEK